MAHWVKYFVPWNVTSYGTFRELVIHRSKERFHEYKDLVEKVGYRISLQNTEKYNHFCNPGNLTCNNVYVNVSWFNIALRIHFQDKLIIATFSQDAFLSFYVFCDIVVCWVHFLRLELKTQTRCSLWGQYRAWYLSKWHVYWHVYELESGVNFVFYGKTSRNLIC